ncbi:MAG: S8 family serine peptidase [candidate division Zixibacteria bacterium]|nr:S8 family serine peptidase [candidate division Zixibacteria bacterium]
MRNIQKLFMVGFAVIILSGNVLAQYYYSDNRQVPLLVDSNKITILFSDEVFLDTIGQYANYYNRINSLIEDEESIGDFQTFALNSSIGYSEFTDTLRSSASVKMVNPYYMCAPGENFLVGESFCCKFQESTSYFFIDSLNDANGVEIVYEKNYAPKEYLLKVNANAVMPTLEMANYYYELSEVEFSHPDFLGGIVLDGTPVYDYYWSNQWAMQRVFNTSASQPEITAFEITAGSPDIVVAVLDDGVAVHEDIPASRILQGYDFACGDDTPVPCNNPGYGYHGQACAGIIGAGYTVDSLSANDPNTGVCGVAPNCRILPIKIMSSFDSLYTECCHGISVSVMGRAIDTAWIMGADILASSWHYNVPVDIVHQATWRASYYGRDGKGCGIFHSTGNTYSGNTTYPGIMYQVISVGSIDPDDRIWSYSNYSKVDVVAPGGSFIAHVDKIWTTDQMGELGGNRTGDAYDCGPTDDVNYLCSFAGTSSAQPVAAGVGALVLSRRPELTNYQLREVIKNSADPEMSISITSPPHQKYGYGMVHPLRALLAVTRGDANNDGRVNVGDAVYLVNHVFQGGPAALPDFRTGDANCDGTINVGDTVYLINFIFKGGPPPPLCYEYDYN